MRDRIRRLKTHQENECPVKLCEGLVVFSRPVRRVACDDRKRPRRLPVCDRDTESLGNRNRRAHARHKRIRHGRLPERKDFLAATAEDETVASLETHRSRVFLRAANQNLIYIILRHAVSAEPLAHIDQLRAGLCLIQQSVIDQVVIDDGVRAPQLLESPQRDQAAAAAGPDQYDSSICLIVHTHTSPRFCSFFTLR